MRRMMWIAVLAGALLAVGGFAAPSANAAGEVTGRIVHETVPAVFDYVYDPITDTTETIIVSPPVYEGVTATVVAYGPIRGGRAGVVRTVQTDGDGNFTISGLTDNVYLEVVPSSEWQTGWLWVDAMTDWPGFASWLQQAPPSTFDVTPGMNVGMLQPLPGVASGRVVDVDTGDGIAGATVRYDPVDTGRKAFSTTTDTAGYYVLAGLDGEEYAVRASAKRYVGGYLGAENLLYATFGEATTFPGGPLPGDVINMARR